MKCNTIIIISYKYTNNIDHQMTLTLHLKSSATKFTNNSLNKIILTIYIKSYNNACDLVSYFSVLFSLLETL
jgi:hypothetical protein